MILHERCELQVSVADRYGALTWTTKAVGVPCEMVPQSSSEKNDRGVTVTTTYLFLTRSTVIPSTQTNWRILWRG